MNKRIKLILGIVLGFIIIAAGTLFTLSKLGIVNFGIFADVNSPSLNLVVDPNQGEVFTSKVDEAIAMNQYKLSAIPKNAGLRFDRWEATSDKCTFLDSSKAITITDVKGTCKITAKFKPVDLTVDRTGYEEICTPQDFDKIRNNLSGKFVQTCDIDMAGINFQPIGEGPNVGIINDGSVYPPNNIFSGTYDGNGKTISNLNIETGENNTGFIAVNNGKISNLTMNSPRIFAGFGQTGAITGMNAPRGEIANVVIRNGQLGPSSKNTDPTKGSNFIGLVAGQNNGKINNSVVTGEYTGKANYNSMTIGLLAGYGWPGSSIENSYSYGEIKQATSITGGLVGRNNATYSTSNASVIINNCFSNVNIEAQSAGGLVGVMEGSKTDPPLSASTQNKAIVTNSFAVGNITLPPNSSLAGGLIGMANNTILIDKTYAYGNQLTGAGALGGLIGEAYGDNSIPGSTVSNSYAKTHIEPVDTKGIRSIGGFVGHLWTNGIFSNNSATSQISSEPSAITCKDIGGFAGFVSAASSSRALIIEKSNAITSINLSTCGGASGFVGTLFGSTIRNSYATGSINIRTNAAGFFAFPDDGVPHGITGQSNWNNPNDADCAIHNNYSNVAMKISAPVSKDTLGGFSLEYFPSNTRAYIENNYWNKDIAGTTFSSYAGAGAKTSAQMKEQSTYQGWDFGKIWKIDEGKSNPTIRGELLQFSRFETLADTNPTTGTPSTTPETPITTPAPTCTPLKSETRTTACPTGQTGGITQTRTSTCPGPTWSEWKETVNTCKTSTVQTKPITGTVTGYKIYKFLWFSYKVKQIMSGATVQLSNGKTYKTDKNGKFTTDALPIGETYQVWAYSSLASSKCGVSNKIDTKVGSGQANIILNCY